MLMNRKYKIIKIVVLVLSNCFLLILTLFSGAVYEYLKNLVATNYRTIYLDYYSLFLVIVTALAVLSDKIKVSKPLKICVCATVAALCLLLYFIVSRRLIAIHIQDFNLTLMSSRYLIAILFGFEIISLILTVFNRKDPT